MVWTCDKGWKKEDYQSERALYCNVEGTRNRERQDKTCIDNVKRDLKDKNLDVRTAVKIISQNTMEELGHKLIASNLM